MANPLSTHIPKEITEYREKIIGGLTLRQLICVAIAILLGVGTYFALHRLLGWDATQSSYVIMATVALPAAIGFLRPGGMNCEQYLLIVWQHYCGTRPRIYATQEEVTYYVTAPHGKIQNAGQQECLCGYIATKKGRRRIIRNSRQKIRQAQREIRKTRRELSRQLDHSGTRKHKGHHPL